MNHLGKCKYLGKWYNELGSCMEITNAENGQLTGTYESKVGDAKYEYVMTGRYDTCGASIGWTVMWKNSTGSSRSITSWSGQCQQINPGVDAILTTWLLTSETRPENDWNSTNVGKDIFTQEKPDPEVCMRALKSGHISHPKSICTWF